MESFQDQVTVLETKLYIVNIEKSI